MKFTSILIPVAGRVTDESAIKLACTIAQKPGTRIYATYVIELKHNISLDTAIDAEIKKAEEVLDHARELAIREKCDIETSLLQAREVGVAIVDEAIEKGADLILMAVSYKRRFGTFSLGDIIPYVLKKAPCPVMLVQEPASAE